MLAIQKLIVNGTSVMVTIPRPFMRVLGWLPGQTVMVEMQLDKAVKIRRPRERDFEPKKKSAVELSLTPEDQP